MSYEEKIKEDKKITNLKIDIQSMDGIKAIAKSLLVAFQYDNDLIVEGMLQVFLDVAGIREEKKQDIPRRSKLTVAGVQIDHTDSSIEELDKSLWAYPIMLEHFSAHQISSSTDKRAKKYWYGHMLGAVKIRAMYKGHIASQVETSIKDLLALAKDDFEKEWVKEIVRREMAEKRPGLKAGHGIVPLKKKPK